MIFSSITFLFLYMPLVVMIYFLLPKLFLKNIFLTLVSLLFYAWGEPVYVFLMLISVFMNWRFSIAIHKHKDKSKQIMFWVLFSNLGILCYFKYAAFLVELVNYIPGIDFNVPIIPLPIGISFFTFQALSYVVDVKRGDVKVQKNYFDLLLYISLFPQLIAGPIVKYHHIENQLKERKINIERVAEGFERFLYGLGKKIFIANNMAYMADSIFSIELAKINIYTAWLGALAYSFQIYFDFSGYSDMAIGLGKVFGFDFQENFNYPYVSKSIKEFWRRWHISLSTWFKEYLYIPLGGSRVSPIKTYRNLGIVFLATGLWHGANLTFLVWGMVHGILLILENTNYSPVKLLKFSILQRIYTLTWVVLLFVIFRADTISYGLEFVGIMLNPFRGIGNNMLGMELLNKFHVLIFILAFIGATGLPIKIVKYVREYFIKKENMAIVLTSVSYMYTLLLLILCGLSLAANAYNPFIYFRF